MALQQGDDFRVVTDQESILQETLITFRQLLNSKQHGLGGNQLQLIGATVQHLGHKLAQVEE